MRQPVDVLIVRFSSLGDVILTTPLVRALAARIEGARITIVTRQEYADVFAGNPHVDRVVTLARGEPIAPLASRLRDRAYRWRIDLQFNPRSLALRALLGGHWHGYSRQRFARAALIAAGVDLYGDARPMAERYFDALRSAGVRPDGDPPEVFTSLEAQSVAAASYPHGGILLAPGARHPTRRWPADRWRELARRIRASGRQVAGLGTGGECAIFAELDVPVVENEPLRVAAAVVRQAQLLVANDSGLMHLATATGTPVVALFGPTVRQFGFFPYTRRARVLQAELPCRPCTRHGGDRCPLGHHRCMTDIQVEQVLASIEEL